MVPLSERKSLSQYGFNTKETLSSLNFFTQQVESHALHVIEDRVVSNAYSYFINNGHIFIDRERNIPLSVDNEERGGLASKGINMATQLALSHPEKVIFWYSPPGPVAFNSDTRYEELRPYPDGQLYIMIGTNNNQIDALAVTVGKEQEEQVLSTFLGDKYRLRGFDDQIQKIIYHLTHPIVTDKNINDLFAFVEGISYLNDFLVFKNVHNENYALSAVLHELRQGWLKKIVPRIKIDYKQLYEISRREGSAYAYLSQLQSYLPIYGNNGTMLLGGSCGGYSANDGVLKSLINIDQFNPLSTSFRLGTGRVTDIINNQGQDEFGSLTFSCPVCSGEHTRPPHKLLEICPSDPQHRPIIKC